MKIVWDEPKRLTNLANQGVDFADLDPEPRSARQTKAALLRLVERAGITITVVFRPLGAQAVSIISMRPASRKERKQ